MMGAYAASSVLNVKLGTILLVTMPVKRIGTADAAESKIREQGLATRR